MGANREERGLKLTLLKKSASVPNEKKSAGLSVSFKKKSTRIYTGGSELSENEEVVFNVF